jgi:hypothetical protein
MTLAEKLYAELRGHGVDVIFDDRDERPGVKFKDSNWSVSIRLAIGEKSLAKGEVEPVPRRAFDSGQGDEAVTKFWCCSSLKKNEQTSRPNKFRRRKTAAPLRARCSSNSLDQRRDGERHALTCSFSCFGAHQRCRPCCQPFVAVSRTI